MAFDHDRRRGDLLDQAGYLIEEIDSVAAQRELLVDDVADARPFDDAFSIKEYYALIGVYDRQVYLPAVKAMIIGEEPEARELDDDELLDRSQWSIASFEQVLTFVQESRRALLECLESIGSDVWERKVVGERGDVSISGIVYAAIQHDADIMRAVATRLSESRLPR